MAKDASPFAGVKLSEQTRAAAPGLDQRLFASRPATPATIPQPEALTITPETRKQVIQQPGKPANPETSKPGNRFP